MKRRGLPLWLLRHVPALLGVMISFSPLKILAITNGRRAASGKKVRQSTYDKFSILLAHAEARLAFALWRQAYRRLGLNVRGVIFHLVPASETWDDTCDRFRTYSRASRETNAHVDACVDDLRAFCHQRTRDYKRRRLPPSISLCASEGMRDSAEGAI